MDASEEGKSRKSSAMSGKGKRKSSGSSDDDFQRDFDDDVDDGNTSSFRTDDNVVGGADDNYDPNRGKKGPVDLMALLGIAAETVEAAKAQAAAEITAAGGETEDEEGHHEEEDVGIEFEYNEDYETDEEETEAGDGEVDPSDEFHVVETLSQQQLRLQKEHWKRIAKQKKKALIKEYYTNFKRLYHLRLKNTFLTFKVATKSEQRLDIIEKHMQLQKEFIETVKETARLKQLNKESCKAAAAHRRSGEDEPPPPLTSPAETNEEEEDDETWKGKGPKGFKTRGKGRKARRKRKKNFTIGALKHLSGKAAATARKRSMKGGVTDMDKSRCKPTKKGETNKFSFHRDALMEDGLIRRPEDERRAKLLNLKVPEDGFTPSNADVTAHKKELLASRHKGFTAGRKKKSLDMPKDKQEKLRSRLAYDPLARGILVEAPELSVEDLHVFQFQFADQKSLEAKKLSEKIREESMGMLQFRHIPTSHLIWPMKVKGFGYENRNPYGRVLLNYTRLSKEDKEFPLIAYKIVLTNIAFFRAKEKRLLEVEQRNQAEMEEQRLRLAEGRQKIINEIFKGLRVWASVSGVTCRDKREAARETEKFLEDFHRMFEFLVSLFVHLYRHIHSHELALRKLAISEDNGEGTQVHEFKEILRSREKLKMEHKSVQDFITRYQEQSKKVLQKVKRNDQKVHAITNSISQKAVENKNLKKVLTDLDDGIQLCRSIRTKQMEETRELKRNLGLLPYPSVKKEYDRMVATKNDIRMRRFQLKTEISATVRQICQVTPNKVVYSLKSPDPKKVPCRLVIENIC